MLRRPKSFVRPAAAALLTAATLTAARAAAAPEITRLTPPSNLFVTGKAEPIVSRFLPGQRFDLQTTALPGAPHPGRSIPPAI